MALARRVKRVALIVLLAVVVILLSKSLLSKALKNLSVEAEKQQHAKALKETAALPVSAVEETFASAVAGTGTLAIAPESAPLATDSSAASQ